MHVGRRNIWQTNDTMGESVVVMLTGMRDPKGLFSLLQHVASQSKIGEFLNSRETFGPTVSLAVHFNSAERT